ncbi:ABC transporter ATP-binding protein [Jiella sp. MQZ9-1]|uniref:ABC transporter ATP-binding protein n=1 Tax=Jiella flava TaxID=2816857 RepID=A0A939JT70_9HYPH|nr:ABC transporter ATP-binding protein [Jiella flava]MBO0661820.1 ABC transporter ATP-binding protein [Jiella flava]MCD2470460.1 ABC transporter ATP-binding protein [Jiella flava]
MVTLRLEDVGARHGRRQTLTAVTTPRLAGGEIVAVIGPNAAGKSTLFKRIAGLIPGPGEVHLDGTDKAGKAIAYMPQDTGANAVLTVYESVLLARKQGQSWTVDEAELIEIDAVLAALNIADIGQRPLDALSGGQRQLVAIAQTLVRAPDIMLMDEPTSALDIYRQVEVLQLMQNEARRRGMLVMIAIHDLNQALRFADKAIVIVDGRLRACGPCAEVITADMLREVYRIEARIEKCSRDFDHVIVDGKAA